MLFAGLGMAPMCVTLDPCEEKPQTSRPHLWKRLRVDWGRVLQMIGNITMLAQMGTPAEGCEACSHEGQYVKSEPFPDRKQIGQTSWGRTPEPRALSVLFIRHA